MSCYLEISNSFKRLNKISIMMIVVFAFSSCEEKIEEVEQHAENTESHFHHKHQASTVRTPKFNEVVLGKKLNNPYSVKNMNIALQSLRQRNLRLIPIDFTIPVTHYYVKFFIESSEDFETLQQQGLELFSYPLDYEIQQETDYSLPTAQNSVGKWLYTSVPVNFDFNAIQIEYVILEELYLTDDEGTTLDCNGQSGRSAGNYSLYESLEDASITISGIFPDSPPRDISPPILPCEQIQRTKHRPRGFVRVWDSERGVLVPVVGVRVRTRRWFKYGYDYTDENGFYEVDNTYRRDPRYSVIFRNQSGFKIWSSVFAMQRAEHNVGRHDKRGYDVDIQQNSRGWRFATVNNGAVKYAQYCRAMNIGIPDRKLRILATNGDGSSSAPMLTKTWGLLGFTTNSQLVTFLAKANGISLALNKASLFLRFVSPDVIIEANSNQGTAEVYGSTFHELAHASHFEKVGSSYWTKYINYIITYNSYGDGTGNNVGICALGEAWAYHIGYELTLAEFNGVGGTADNSEILAIAVEDFTPFDRPGVDIDWNFINGAISRWEGWIPGGIMSDLIDTTTDNYRAGFIDNAEGYTNEDIYNALDWGIESPQEFRDRLLRESGDRDRNDVINLFEGYFWN
jgi:hypothetical protein